MTKKMIKKKRNNSYISGEKLVKVIEEFKDLIEQYGDAISIEMVEEFNYDGSSSFELHYYVESEETDKEYADRMNVMKKRQEQQEQRELAELERLRKKFKKFS